MPTARLAAPINTAVARSNEEFVARRPAYFWWLLANALALCFAVLSWAVCLNVFGSPELPRNYEILSKVGRTPVLHRYTVLDAPNGVGLAPKELYRKYFGYSEQQLAKVNGLLMRNYLTNFGEPQLLTYIEGDYQIGPVRKLSATDFLDPGIVLQAQALVKPDDFTKPVPYPLFIEYVFPTRQADSAARFSAGDILSVKKNPNCAAVIHVSKIAHGDESALLLTVIPIAYGPYQIGNLGSFEIDPPVKVRPGCRFPILRN